MAWYGKHSKTIKLYMSNKSWQVRILQSYPFSNIFSLFTSATKWGFSCSLKWHTWDYDYSATTCNCAMCAQIHEGNHRLSLWKMERKDDIPVLTNAVITGTDLVGDNELRRQTRCRRSQQPSHFWHGRRPLWHQLEGTGRGTTQQDPNHSAWKASYGLRMIRGYGEHKLRPVSLNCDNIPYFWHVLYSCMEDIFGFS